MWLKGFHISLSCVHAYLFMPGCKYIESVMRSVYIIGNKCGRANGKWVVCWVIGDESLLLFTFETDTIVDFRPENLNAILCSEAEINFPSTHCFLVNHVVIHVCECTPS